MTDSLPSIISIEEAKALGLKRCGCCKLALPLEMFSKNRAEKSGLRADCKDCAKIRNAPFLEKARAATSAKRAEKIRAESIQPKPERYISRDDAKEAGLKWFFTGKICANGHVDERSVSKGSCRECYRNYQRRKGQNAGINGSFVVQPDGSYIGKPCPTCGGKERTKRKACPVCLKRIQLERREKYYRARSEKYHSLSPDEKRKINNKAYENDKDRFKFNARKRNLRQSRAMPPWVSDKEIAEMREFYRKRPNGMHVDHIVPLRHNLVCGLHVMANLQYLPSGENLKKHNKFPYGKESERLAVCPELRIRLYGEV